MYNMLSSLAILLTFDDIASKIFKALLLYYGKFSLHVIDLGESEMVLKRGEICGDI